MHDTVALKERGIPAAAIITEAFLEEARVQRAALGMPDLEPATIAHPLSTLSDEAIRGRAKVAVTQIELILCGGAVQE